VHLKRKCATISSARPQAHCPDSTAPSQLGSNDERDRLASALEYIPLAKVKVPLPNFFDGTRGKLKEFLLQVALYFQFHPTKFLTDKSRTLWTVTLLKGPAFDWIEVYADDHMQNQNNAKQETKDIIDNWAEFREQLETHFGDTDAEQKKGPPLLPVQYHLVRVSNCEEDVV
jgi:hypothetical protein